ncbi:MAG: hypothetical protein NVSMB9_34460 [Isosphaeraceae bacterium]
MNRGLRPILIALITYVSLIPEGQTFAQTSYPMVSRIEPTAVRRGSTVELSFIGEGGNGSGLDFSGAFALLCKGPGLSGKVSGSVPPLTQGTAKRTPTPVGKMGLVVAPDAPLGPHEVRIATPNGVSSVGLVVVIDDPVVVEADDHADDQSKGAQSLVLPCAVSGSIGKAEDVDWYAFEAKAGQKLTFSVWANRLENKIHDLQAHFDPILALHDSTGRELATDDNHDFADPLLIHEITRDGKYYLQVRDTTYGGNPNWTYVLQATNGPVATSLFPLAVKPGTKTLLHAKGPNIDPAEEIVLDVSKDVRSGPQLVALPTRKGQTLATHVVVTSHPIVLETTDTPSEAEKAQTLTIPSAVCGRLGEANDTDAFRFEAKKGQIFTLEIVARRAGASTDPVLQVLDAKGAELAEADDTPGLGKDCLLEWTAPSDGSFRLVASDLHLRGGDDFGYVLLARQAHPDFSLRSDPDKVNVGPGGRVPLFVHLTRQGGFDGPVTLDLGALPPGVTASPLTIGPKMSDGVVVVSASADAKPAASLLRLTGKASTSAGPVARDAIPGEEIYLPGGGRGVYPVDTLALGVTEPPDIRVEATPKTISLKPGGTAAIDVKVTRKAGFEQGVNLAIVLEHLGGIHANPLPPGVTFLEAGSKTLLGPKETQGKIMLQAAPTAAAIDNVPICVMGHVSINFVVKTAFASEPILIQVAP